MRWFLIFHLRLRSLFRRAAVERELDDELRLHFDLQVQQNLAAGMSAAEARNAASRQFGPLTQEKEECRDARGTQTIETFMDDIRYAVRILRRDPFLAVTATLTLAACIGANTAVFSAANSILIRPLPYPASDRIDWISERSGPMHEDIGAAPDYYRLREGNRVFEEVAAFQPMTVNRTGVERPEQLDAALVSASFFRVMGMQPLLGRYFAPDEEGSTAPSAIVLSYAFWRTRLGEVPQVIGKTIAIDRLPRTVIGVMPQGFDFPRDTQMWIPLPIDESSERPILPTKPIFTVSLLARRKAGVRDAEVAADLNRLTHAIRAEYKVFPTRFRWDLVIAARPLQEHLTGQLRPTLLVLSGAAGLVLLIACVNLANLLLARAAGRRHELAIRLALGSGRGRIVRQMLTESFVLAVPGGTLGVVLAWLAVHALNSAQPAILTRYPPISMAWPVLVFTLSLTFATSLLFGMAPAAAAAGIRIRDALKAAGTMQGGSSAARLRKLLVVAELGISLVLLIGAGLLTRSFLKLAHTELGFRSDHLLSFRVLPIGPFWNDYSRFYAAVLERVRQLPGVEAATLLSDIPLSDESFYWSGRIRVLGRPMVPFVERPLIYNTVVSPEFFHTLGIPLRSGRIFDWHDAPRPGSASLTNFGVASAAVVVVNEAFAQKIFPGEDPLGRRVLFGPDRNGVTWTIAGVVDNVRGGALGADPPPMVYRCTCEGSLLSRAGFMIRTTGDPRAAIRAIERAVRTVDRDQPIFDVKTMDERREAALAPERFQLALIGAFAAIAVLLAAAGVYGVMSYLVSRRTREIGIRMALGAQPVDVLTMVAGETAGLVLIAIVLGLASAWALTRYIGSMLYGVSRLDPAVIALTPVVLAAVVLIAALGPARRAVRIDPMKALREE